MQTAECSCLFVGLGLSGMTSTLYQCYVKREGVCGVRERDCHVMKTAKATAVSITLGVVI